MNNYLRDRIFRIVLPRLLRTDFVHIAYAALSLAFVDLSGPRTFTVLRTDLTQRSNLLASFLLLAMI